MPVLEQHHQRGASRQDREQCRQGVHKSALQVFALQVARERVRFARHRQEMEIQRDELLERGINRAEFRDELR